MSLIENKKAHYSYEILQVFEAGIELRGIEVKALRQKHGSLDGGYVIIRGGESYLVNATIPPYQTNNTPPDYDPTRARRLLLTKNEIMDLTNQTNKTNLTIVPLSIYNKGRKIKISIGVARGRKKYDKREVLKKRQTDREVRRTLKSQ